MLSNNGMDVWDSFAHWLPHQLGEGPAILVAMDWTDLDHDHDDQATLALHLVTGHGREAQSLWRTGGVPSNGDREARGVDVA